MAVVHQNRRRVAQPKRAALPRRQSHNLPSSFPLILTVHSARLHLVVSGIFSLLRIGQVRLRRTTPQSASSASTLVLRQSCTACSESCHIPTSRNLRAHCVRLLGMQWPHCCPSLPGSTSHSRVQHSLRGQHWPHSTVWAVSTR